MFASPEEAVKFILDNRIEMVDLKVVSLSGRWLHITIPAQNFTAEYFEEGVGYDGSSGSGFGRVESGDVSAVPDPATGFVDPFPARPTLSLICNTVTADKKDAFPHDPRTIARRAEAYLRRSGVADEALFGPEFEFHIFDRVEVVNEPFGTGVNVVAAETSGEGVLPRIPLQQGYMRLPPTDQLHDLRTEIVQKLERLGIQVRYHHHEVGASGQCEIETKLMPLVRAADATMLIKYVVKGVAARHGKLATFMPKPIYGEAGNGMHVHQRLTKGGEPLFFDGGGKGYADLSDTALHYVAGLLQHGAALTGLTKDRKSVV